MSNDIYTYLIYVHIYIVKVIYVVNIPFMSKDILIYEVLPVPISHIMYIHI